MSTCAIVGINWGDEGKGRMVDLVAQDYDVVVRYQGGNNAGHTVVNQYGEFKLNLIPSGIFRKEVVNVLGNGTVIDLQHLYGEIENLRKAGIEITPDNFKISDRAIVVFPYHKDLDGLEEERLKDAKYGSTKRGIAPVYSDKFQKKAVMMGELLYPDYLKKHLAGILEWKNLTIQNVYGAKPYELEDLFAWAMEFGGKLAPHVCDTGKFLRDAENSGKKILFEAQLGVLRDIDFGITPYTSSSSPIAAYAPVGSGMPGAKLEKVIGITKAYSTCVGEGPFTAEWFGEEAEELRKAGGEYGAATGRPRRVGPFDVVATRYGVTMQAATCLAITKMDVLSYMDEIPICTQYELNGELTDEFPFPAVLADAKPVFKTMKGWKQDISKIRRYEDLPVEAREYVEFVEKAVGCPITYVSVGPDRNDIIYR